MESVNRIRGAFPPKEETPLPRHRHYPGTHTLCCHIKASSNGRFIVKWQFSVVLHFSIRPAPARRAARPLVAAQCRFGWRHGSWRTVGSVRLLERPQFVFYALVSPHDAHFGRGPVGACVSPALTCVKISMCWLRVQGGGVGVGDSPHTGWVAVVGSTPLIYLGSPGFDPRSGHSFLFP